MITISMMTVLMIRVSIRQESHLPLMMALENIPDELLDCLEQNNAHATFFMLGQNVGSWQSQKFSEWWTLDVRSDLIPGII